jgi:hypothetical protein
LRQLLRIRAFLFASHSSTPSVPFLGAQVLRLYAGQYFGERALLTSAKRAANVVASGRVTLLAISRAKFESVFGSLQVIRRGWGPGWRGHTRTESREQPDVEEEEEGDPIDTYQLILIRIALFTIPSTAAPPLNRPKRTLRATALRLTARSDSTSGQFVGLACTSEESSGEGKWARGRKRASAV